jgi:GDP-L-fucose synthase
VKKQDKIFVAGAKGMVGSAIVRELKSQGYSNIFAPSRSEVDLEKLNDVDQFFNENKPAFVFLAAAKVGGIIANSTYPVEFLNSNLQIQQNIINSSFKHQVQKLLFLGSSCIYPKFAKQPISENELLSGPLEPTNDAYAIAKIAGIKLCQAYNKQYDTNYISTMPTNLYGPGDNYHPNNSHVIPGLIRRFHEAKKNQEEAVTVWGTGSPKREFLYVDDLAQGCIHLMSHYNDSEIVNIGTGEDLTIAELARLIADVVEYPGEIVFDSSKPDGTPRKVLDVKKINDLGWKFETSFKDGLRYAYNDFLSKQKSGQLRAV